jgi:Amiloride-sensitive sodium channel
LKIKSRKTDDALREFSPETRKCYFEGEKPLKFFKSYTKLNCEWDCKANAMVKDCGCVHYNMPRENSTKVCNIDEMSDCKPNKTECDCYAPCNDFTFDVMSETSQFDPFVSRNSLDYNM